MEEQPILNEELGSELTGLNKGEKDLKKKLVIGSLIGISILIILAIIIIIAVSLSMDAFSL